jgi:hypothetical protein
MMQYLQKQWRDTINYFDLTNQSQKRPPLLFLIGTALVLGGMLCVAFYCKK